MIDLIRDARRGRIRAPLKTCIYGGPGIGKTTFAASAPGVVLIPVEEGAEQIGCDRLPQPQTWSELLEQLDALAQQKHDWKNVAIDTLGAAEELAETVVMGSDRSMRDAAGGYGAGYDVLAGEWKLFLSRLERLRKNGIGVILIAHAQVKAFADPTLGSYDRYIPRLRERTWGQVHAWCDDVLFARKTVGIAKTGKHDRARAVFGEERTVHPIAGAGFEAKNRYGLAAPFPLEWSAWMAGVDAFWADGDVVRQRIAELAASSGNEAYVKRATELVEAAKGDTRRLLLIESQLREKLESMKESTT
jgi:hypothetical protein